MNVLPIKIDILGRLACVLPALFLISCGSGGGSGGAAVFPQAPVSIALTQVAGGFNNPVSITHAADGSGRLFIVEQSGTIRILNGSTINPDPFLDITGIVTSGGEQGLLGLAFPPDFATRRTFYIHYTDQTGVGNTSIARFGLTADDDIADPATGQVLLNIVQPSANHNGGQLAFGPDHLLYIGMGDGGGTGDPSGNAQNLTSLLGKILRIDVLSTTTPYAIPAGNPFANEIWAYGLRNPWRFSFDRLTGDIYIADVGQSEVEEINYQASGNGAGVNYGWNIMEGSQCYNSTTCSTGGLSLPVAEYYHTDGNCSVTGGYVYRGAITALQGMYIYGDFCSGRIWGLRRNGSVYTNTLLADTALYISTFGEDEAGELYVADYATGNIYRIGEP